MSDIILEGTAAPVTTTAAVRLVCGADVKEFPDQAFMDGGLIEDLELNLNSWLDGSSSGLNYVTIIGRGTSQSPTAEERADYLNLKKYSKYYLGAVIAKTIPLGFAETTSDGQNMFKRFSMNVDDLVGRLMSVAEEAKKSILDSHISEEEIKPVFAGVGNSYDPVTDSE